MRWFAQPWLPATVAISLIYAAHAGLAGESKIARANPSDIVRSHPTQVAALPATGEASAAASGRVRRHPSRHDYTAIRRICRVLTPETRRILLSCR